MGRNALHHGRPFYHHPSSHQLHFLHATSLRWSLAAAPGAAAPLHVVQVDGPHDHGGAQQELDGHLQPEEEVGEHAAQYDGEGAGVACSI